MAGKAALLPALALGGVLLSGCSAGTKDEWKRIAMPDPASAQGEHTLSLWQGAWIAALITGVVVWGLIFYVIWKYRRRSATEIPVQTRYNLPLELLYTVVPVMMVVVFFAHTVKAQNAILDDDLPVDNTIEVVGQQWTWTFNYGLGARNDQADEDPADDQFPYSSYAVEVGDASHIPTLYLPVDKTTRFNLHSPDVIHNFGIPGFLMRMDVIPGRVNHYSITPTREGTYAGKCYELCGVSHSRMLFKVEVVSQAEYDARIQELAERGEQPSPLLGGTEAVTQDGLHAHENEGDAE